MTNEELTAIDVHESIAARCTGCGRPAVMKIRTYIAPIDLVQKAPELAGVLMSRTPDGSLPTVRMSDKSHMVPVAEIAACPLCQKTAELIAARAPSWAMVVIERLSNPTNKVQVAVSSP